MRDRILRLFQLRYAYPNQLEADRARVLVRLSWVVMVIAALWIVFADLIPLLTNTASATASADLVLTSLILLVTAGIYWLVQTGRLALASLAFVAILLVGSIYGALVEYPLSDQAPISHAALIVLVIPLVAAALLRRREIWLVAGILTVMVIYAALVQSQSAQPVTYIPGVIVFNDASIVLAAILMMTLFLGILGGAPERIANEALTNVQERQWIHEFSHQLDQSADEADLTARTLVGLRDHYGFLFTQFYSLGEGGVLRRSQGGATQLSRAEGGDLRLGLAHPIGEAAQRQGPVIITGDSPDARRAYLTPPAAAGLAVPVIHQGTVLGVLDVQQTAASGFSPAQVAWVQLLTDEFARLLARIRNQSELQRALREQDNNLRRLESQVLDYQQRDQRGVGATWQQYLVNRAQEAIGFNLEAGASPEMVAAHDLPPTLRATLASGQVAVETVGDEQLINIPITFRDYTLGVMSFAVSKDQAVSERQLEMAQTVAQRLALALDNSRLLEQTQAQAQRERTASDVTQYLIGATDVNTVLNRAAESFNQALGALYTRIYIQPEALAEETFQSPSQEGRA
jgi:GAF domain-containing protein